MHKLPKVNSRDIATELFEISEEHKRQIETHSVEHCLDLAAKSIEKCDFDTALLYVDRAIELDPDNPRLIIDRAKVFIFAKKYQDALETVEYLLYLDPKDSDGLMAKKILEIKIDHEKLVTAFPLYA